MKFLEQLNIDLEQYNLLNHPFYQLWNMGKLTHTTLQNLRKRILSSRYSFPTLYKCNTFQM